MTSEEELNGFRRDRYFARAWALLTRDRGWIKPVLVMTAAMFVPVVGVLGVLGYALEWARLTAWGVNSAPKQKKVRVGACIASGWRVFVVLFVWGFCSALIGSILEHVPFFGDILEFVWDIFEIFIGLLAMVGALRATIYQKIIAGLRVKTIWQMGTHDAGGLLRVFGIGLLGACCMTAVSFFVLVSSLTSMLPELHYYLNEWYWYGALSSAAFPSVQILLLVISTLGPALLVLLLLLFFLVVVMWMLCYTALGLWMRQFDVSAWGKDEDPLPPFVGDPRDEQHAGPQGPQQSYEPPRPTPAEDVVVEPVTPEPAPAPAPEPTPAPVSEPATEEEHEPILMPAAAPEVVAAAEASSEPKPADPEQPEATGPEQPEATPADEPDAPDEKDPNQSE